MDKKDRYCQCKDDMMLLLIQAKVCHFRPKYRIELLCSKFKGSIGMHQVLFGEDGLLLSSMVNSNRITLLVSTKEVPI